MFELVGLCHHAIMFETPKCNFSNETKTLRWHAREILNFFSI